ncbi:Aste57867_2945 [Aphanomyces stellatus]|uniref:HECT-type E3 ubiquitin transferase n=1 Tax=Aphanomyces stellatus TaxID=120398 RepID=A0A485KCF3_9STRA|nr:hypothetical protein As57867_002937 [Aphanomyces stellatus]VFT80128.1 Aste57867_2945 [Aphanomyces stellatus]
MASRVGTVNVQEELLVLVGFSLVAIVAVYYCRKKFKLNDVPLMPNEHVGHLRGLKRDALEDPSLEAKKWTCNICAFRNSTERPACALCCTNQMVHLLVVPEFATSDGVVSFDQLNNTQRSARLRNQWSRQLDDGRCCMVWKADLKTTGTDPFYVIGRPNENSKLRILSWKPRSAGQTVMGERVPFWWYDQLLQLQPLGFSLKYAWLISSIAASIQSYIKMKVFRTKLFDESVQLLSRIPRDQICSMTKISLLGEKGIDAGGVTREWYSLLTNAILEPERGLFVTNKADRSLFINPNSAKDHGSNHLQVYHAIGRLLGKAIVDGQVLPFQFSVPLFKALLGYPVSIEDIRYLDPVVYSSLVFVRDCTSDVAELALTFSATLDASTEVDLVPNGRAIEVTCANKAEYIERMVQYLLFDRVAPQLEKMVQGLYDVLPQELLMPFDYKELELVLCGFAEIDVDDWKRSTNVTEDLKEVAEWFWDMVEFDMTMAEREKLLQFTTGSSRVPLQGFKALTSYDGNLCPFHLQSIPYTRGAFPRVHSCFNRIDLPVYPNRTLLREGILVLLQINDAEFTMA